MIGLLLACRAPPGEGPAPEPLLPAPTTSPATTWGPPAAANAPAGVEPPPRPPPFECPEPALEPDATYEWFDLDPCVLDPTTVCTEHRHRLIQRIDGAPLRDELLVFLPPGPGSHNDTILSWGAYAGYRQVSLGWLNADHITECQFEPDPESCLADVRFEQLYGEDTSSLVEVWPQDSIAGRMEALLQVLGATYPDAGWDRYWNAVDGVRWDRMVVWGWSYGAGQTAFLGMHERLDGLVLLSGPKEGVLPDLDPAPWVYEGRATPACAQFAVYHALESWSEPGELLPVSLGALGLVGTVDADTSAPPYDGAQILTTLQTDYREPDCNYHGAIGDDGCIAEALVTPYVHVLCAAADVDLCPE